MEDVSEDAFFLGGPDGLDLHSAVHFIGPGVADGGEHPGVGALKLDDGIDLGFGQGLSGDGVDHDDEHDDLAVVLDLGPLVDLDEAASAAGHGG